MGLSTGSFIYTISFFVLFLVVGLSLSTTSNVFVLCSAEITKNFKFLGMGKREALFVFVFRIEKKGGRIVFCLLFQFLIFLLFFLLQLVFLRAFLYAEGRGVFETTHERKGKGCINIYPAFLFSMDIFHVR